MMSPQPIHSDKHRGSALHMLSPAIAAVMVVMGLLQGDPVTLLLGVGLSLFVWFTRHARYEIFQDRLVIHYGQPRQKVLQLTEIKDVHLVQFGMGRHFLLIRGNRGQRIVLRPADPERFLERLDDARRGLAE